MIPTIKTLLKIPVALVNTEQVFKSHFYTYLSISTALCHVRGQKKKCHVKISEDALVIDRSDKIIGTIVIVASKHSTKLILSMLLKIDYPTRSTGCFD